MVLDAEEQGTYKVLSLPVYCYGDDWVLHQHSFFFISIRRLVQCCVL